MENFLLLIFLSLASLTVNICHAQNPELTSLPTFNIARDKKVTVNATCGQDTEGETYCKLVGYDSFFVKSTNRIITGQVRK